MRHATLRQSLSGFGVLHHHPDKRIDRAILSTYIKGHVNDAMNLDFGKFVLMVSLRSTNSACESTLSGME